MKGLSVNMLSLLYRAIRGGAPIDSAASGGKSGKTYHEPEESAVTQAIRSALGVLRAADLAEDERRWKIDDAKAYASACGERCVPLGVSADELEQLSLQYNVRGHSMNMPRDFSDFSVRCGYG